ncbi:hypothetical protein, partial [Vibrio cholerae]|uniref:hypothetical protein n=1 Tax=Vibrio cholerae TaxID=666 RepID=UPI001F24C4EF
IFFVSVSFGIRFTNLPNVFVPAIFPGGNLSALNNVYSPTFLWLTQASYSDFSAFGTNVSYKITPDIYGCASNLDPIVCAGALASSWGG